MSRVGFREIKRGTACSRLVGTACWTRGTLQAVVWVWVARVQVRVTPIPCTPSDCNTQQPQCKWDNCNRGDWTREGMCLILGFHISTEWAAIYTSWDWSFHSFFHGFCGGKKSSLTSVFVLREWLCSATHSKQYWQKPEKGGEYSTKTRAYGI